MRSESPALFLRLSQQQRDWVAEQARVHHCSMNAVVIVAIESLRAVRSRKYSDSLHAAAIETAISAAGLPVRTQIILNLRAGANETEVLVREPGSSAYRVLARVQADQIEFVDDIDATPTTEGEESCS